MTIDSELLREAIAVRDALIERVRGPNIDSPGDADLIDAMHAACRRVEELAQREAD
jgi:hypothetical protein